MNAKKRAAVFSRFKQANPKPTTELRYRSRYELLVAVMLSAQATDIGVNKATRELFKVANTPKKMVALGLHRLKPYIRTIGLFNTKAKNIMATSRLLIEEHNNRIPANRAALESLPGVGRKTANVILNTAFGQDTIAVDTHIFRVSNRTGIAPGKTPLAVEKNLCQLVPPAFKHGAHHWLILHGRYVCKALKPNCNGCLINDLCEWEGKLAIR